MCVSICLLLSSLIRNSELLSLLHCFKNYIFASCLQPGRRIVGAIISACFSVKLTTDHTCIAKICYSAFKVKVATSFGNHVLPIECNLFHFLLHSASLCRLCFLCFARLSKTLQLKWVAVQHDGDERKLLRARGVCVEDSNCVATMD